MTDIRVGFNLDVSRCQRPREHQILILRLSATLFSDKCNYTNKQDRVEVFDLTSCQEELAPVTQLGANSLRHVNCHRLSWTASPFLIPPTPVSWFPLSPS